MNMKKIIVSLFCFMISVWSLNAQTDTAKVNLYNPAANAKQDIKTAVDLAAKTNKQVMIQVGGNWCSWCIKFHKMIRADKQMDSLLTANYVYILVNYSKENKNPEVLQQLDNPQRFGYPVLVILDQKGKRLHTQNTAYLEEGKGYSKEKVIEFFKSWTVTACDPASYK